MLVATSAERVTGTFLRSTKPWGSWCATPSRWRISMTVKVRRLMSSGCGVQGRERGFLWELLFGCEFVSWDE